VDQSFMPAAGPARFDLIRAGPYLAAVDRIGSPAYSESELPRQPEGKRHDADAIVVSALGIRLIPARQGDPLRDCRRAAATFAIEPPGVSLTSSTAGRVAVGRFALGAAVALGGLPAGQRVDLRIPKDRSQRPWRALVTPAPASLTVCRLP
jgi:hypothetical protein